MNESQYNDHVQFNMGDLVHNPKVRGLDIFLGVLLLLCTLVGVPGNVVALRYFTTARRAVLPTFIYTAIASVDICTGNRWKWYRYHTYLVLQEKTISEAVST